MGPPGMQLQRYGCMWDAILFKSVEHMDIRSCILPILPDRPFDNAAFFSSDGLFDRKRISPYIPFHDSDITAIKTGRLHLFTEQMMDMPVFRHANETRCIGIQPRHNMHSRRDLLCFELSGH